MHQADVILLNVLNIIRRRWLHIYFYRHIPPPHLFYLFVYNIHKPMYLGSLILMIDSNV